MTLKRRSLTLQLLSAFLLFTPSGLSAVIADDDRQDVVYTHMTKTLGTDVRARERTLKPLFAKTLQVMEPSVKSFVQRQQRRQEKLPGKELTDWGTGSAEGTYAVQRDAQQQSVQTDNDKRGWEGISLKGKKRTENPVSLSKKGWEGIQFHGKRGWEGINFNGKRESLSGDTQHEGKRGWEGVYGGKKRSSNNGRNQIMQEVTRYSATKKGWEGLITGKRGWEGLFSGKRGWEGLFPGKRGWEGLTTGKRGWEGVFGKRRWEGIGAGRGGWEGITRKRGWEGVFGKRGWEGVFGKRGWEGVFGKRGWEGLFSGKRGWEGVHNMCNCCEGNQFRSCCSSCGRTSSGQEKKVSRVEVIRDIVCVCCDRVEVPSCCEVCQAMSQSH